MASTKWLMRRRNFYLKRRYKHIYRLAPQNYSRWQDVRDEVEGLSRGFRELSDNDSLWVMPHRRGRRHRFRPRESGWAPALQDLCLYCHKTKEASAHKR